MFRSCLLQARYVQAKLSVHDRSLKVATVIESLEMEMELLCLTGVEDQLQADVRPTLEILRNAGIKVRVYTGLSFLNFPFNFWSSFKSLLLILVVFFKPGCL